MNPIDRREFIKKSANSAGVIITAPALIKNMITNSPNERVNIGLAGISGNRPRIRAMISGRGIAHINGYAKVPNAVITTVCDVDERLFPGVVSDVEKLHGTKPKTEVDFRKMCDDKNIDVISIATPDHWHALQTIWACQAGKDVYVEKPVCHNISEGRKMVQAARKYNRLVQAGICYRSSKAVKAGIKLIADGKMGKVYMAKGIVYGYRQTIGHVEDSPIPEGVHWDTFLGPAPYRPFNENRYIYTWHWFWDTSTTEFGNNGIYRMDTIRWALNKNTHPVKVHCSGGKFARDDDQEVPNILIANYEYDDGIIIQNEVRSIYSNPEGFSDSGNIFIYTDQGWMTFSPDGFKTYFGQKNEPGPAMSDKDIPEAERSDGWKNLIECVRSRREEDLDNDIQEGHMSAALGHLGTISYRLSRKLTFDPSAERFINDNEADKLLTRNYRKPYVVPDEV
jgi:predicted dehydrogenase